MEESALSSTMGTDGGGTRSPGRHQQQTVRLVGPRKSELWSEGPVGRERNSSSCWRWQGDLAIQLLFPPPGAGTDYADVLAGHYKIWSFRLGFFVFFF